MKYTLLLLILAIAACDSVRDTPHSRVVIGNGHDALTVVEDTAHGVVCYSNPVSYDALSCVKVTRAK